MKHLDNINHAAWWVCTHYCFVFICCILICTVPSRKSVPAIKWRHRRRSSCCCREEEKEKEKRVGVSPSLGGLDVSQSATVAVYLTATFSKDLWALLVATADVILNRRKHSRLEIKKQDNPSLHLHNLPFKFIRLYAFLIEDSGAALEADDWIMQHFSFRCRSYKDKFKEWSTLPTIPVSTHIINICYTHLVVFLNHCVLWHI